MRPTELLRLAFQGGRADRLRIALSIVASATATLLLLAAVNVIDIRSLGTPGPPAGTVAVVFDDGMTYMGSPDELEQYVAPIAAERGVPVDQATYHEPASGQGPFVFTSYGRYQNSLLDEPGLHVGVVITALALLIPLLLFVGQCARIGAPQRDRRLAAFRMAGATPRQAATIAVTESAMAAVGGAALGTVVFLGLRSIDPQTTDAAGRLRWPTDIPIPLWHYAAVIVVLPALVALGTGAALRKVAISPFGVLRRKPARTPSVLPAALFVGGLAAIAGTWSLAEAVGDPGDWVIVIAFAGFALIVAGLSTGAATIAQRLGRILVRTANSPAALIAGRRTDQAPFQASRPATATLLAVLIAAAIAQTRVNFLATTDPDDKLYASTFDLLNIVLAFGLALSIAGLAVVAAESVVTRRRTLAALAASGTPRSTLASSVLIETLIAIVPLAPIAAAAGTFAARSFFGSTTEIHGAQIAIAIPWGPLAVITAGTIAAALAVTAIGLLFLPVSTSPAELRTAA